MKTKHWLYDRYMAIIDRCENPNAARYADYGGRGIAICPEWRHDYWKFAAYVETQLGLPTKDKHSLDRIDNDYGYFPGNLRWAGYSEQSKNRRNARLWTWGEETLTLVEWSELLEINYDALRERYDTHNTLVRPDNNQLLRKRDRGPRVEWYTTINKKYVLSTPATYDEYDALQLAIFRELL